jgi:uncharacterized caspase-like protein
MVAGLNLTPAQARRVALAIGNAEHKFVPVLKNPVNDATDMAEALAKLGFDKVILKKDLGFEAFRTTLREFSLEAKGAEAAVVFFAGNGIEVEGRNYLVPVDARLQAASHLDLEAIALDTVLAQVAGAKTAIVMLDACRDNPFLLVPGQTRGPHRGVGGRGLRPVEPRHGTFIVYSAQPGHTAADGIGRNSPFTEALLKHLSTPGLELRHLFVRVRSELLAATGGGQNLHVNDALDAMFYFKPGR